MVREWKRISREKKKGKVEQTRELFEGKTKIPLDTHFIVDLMEKPSSEPQNKYDPSIQV